MRSLWNKLHGIQKPAAVFIAIALFFFLLSYLGEMETRSFLKTAKPASGRVSGHAVDIQRADRDKGERRDTYSYRPRVVFKTPEGTEHTFEGLYQTSEPTPPVNTPLDILYDPAKPEIARINTANELYYSARGMNLAAIVALCIGLFLIVIDRIDAIFGLSKPKKPKLTDEEARRAHFGEHD